MSARNPISATSRRTRPAWPPHPAQVLAALCGLSTLVFADAVPAQPAGDQPPPAKAPAADGPGETDPAPAEPAPPPQPDATRAEVERQAQAAAALEARVAEQEKRAAAQDAKIEQLEAELENANLAAEEALDQAAMASEDAEADAQRLRIYGFTDVGFRKMWFKRTSSWDNVMPPAGTFLLGSANLYFDAKPVEGFRALSEIRFTHYPHGSEVGTSFDRTDTRVYDISSPNGRNQIAWGSIVIERAWLEWNDYDALRVRAGYWLTPYGIWNLDHGTPTLISLLLPDFFSMEYFPTHQTGVQLLGTVPTGNWELGYHATISNGRTPGLVDETEDKALGGRVFARLADTTSVTIGASGYYGSYSETDKALESVSPFLVEGTEVVAYDEYALATDLALDANRFRLRAEGVMWRRRYEEGLREAYAPGVYKPDFYRYDTYLLAAYELPWAGLEPFVYGEYISRENDEVWVYSAGVNVHFNAAVKLKSQLSRVHFTERELPDDFTALDTRLVMAF